MFKVGDKVRCFEPFCGYQVGDIVEIKAFAGNGTDKGRALLPHPTDPVHGWFVDGEFTSILDYFERVSGVMGEGRLG